MLDLQGCKARLPAIINGSLIFALSSAMLPVLMVFGQGASAQQATITIAGTVRDAVKAYGFDRITWRDDRTPAD